jgi:hypothetical protein
MTARLMNGRGHLCHGDAGMTDEIEPKVLRNGDREWNILWGDSEVTLLITNKDEQQVRVVKKGIMVTTWPSVGFSIQNPR